MKPLETYEVRLHPHAAGVLMGLDLKTQGRLREALGRLSEGPFRSRPGADILKLGGTRGRQNLYRLRVGKYRVIYAVEEGAVWVTDLFERGRGYRGL